MSKGRVRSASKFYQVGNISICVTALHSVWHWRHLGLGVDGLLFPRGRWRLRVRIHVLFARVSIHFDWGGE